MEYPKLVRLFREVLIEDLVCDLKLEGRESRKIGKCKNIPVRRQN